MALSCGNQGDLPQLVFSANVQDLTLTALKKLVRLEPAVPDMHFESYGSRVALRGKFVPDTLYQMRIAAAPIRDDSGRPLRDPGEVKVFFHLGWKTAFLRWSQSQAIVEAKGPRMLPLQGYGDARADVRIYRIDPLHEGLWPFPDRPVVINEESAPPFPGEEPSTPANTSGYIGADELKAHVRLLGSPLVSRVVDLPLASKSGTTTFGLDLGPLLDEAVGRQRPGSYLVGLRRLTGRPERAYVRVQVTNLSLTAVEERDRALFFVRTLDEAREVRGAKIVIEGMRSAPDPKNSGGTISVPFSLPLTTDEAGARRSGPSRTGRASSASRSRAARTSSCWTRARRPPPSRRTTGPRRPGSSSGSASRSRLPGTMRCSGSSSPSGPSTSPARRSSSRASRAGRPGASCSSRATSEPTSCGSMGRGTSTGSCPTTSSALGVSAEFAEKDVPTGEFQAVLVEKDTGTEVARRSFQIEAYRVPQFEVQLSSASTVRLDGPFKVKAVARYYAGGNVVRPAHRVDGDAPAALLRAEGPRGVPLRVEHPVRPRGPEPRAGDHPPERGAGRRRRGRDPGEPGARPRRERARLPLRGHGDGRGQPAGVRRHRGEGAAALRARA